MCTFVHYPWVPHFPGHAVQGCRLKNIQCSFHIWVKMVIGGIFSFHCFHCVTAWGRGWWGNMTNFSVEFHGQRNNDVGNQVSCFPFLCHSLFPCKVDLSLPNLVILWYLLTGCPFSCFLCFWFPQVACVIFQTLTLHWVICNIANFVAMVWKALMDHGFFYFDS